MGSSKHKWRFSLLSRSPSNLKKPSPPPEFICPISGDLMGDPVIVSSGQTFERNCVLASISLSYKLTTTTIDDFTTIIPNLALKSAILNWCHANSFSPIPQPLHIRSALNIIQNLINNNNNSPPKLSCLSSSSTSEDDSVVAAVHDLSPSPRPLCYSSSSSSSLENDTHEEEEEEGYDTVFISQLKSGLMLDQENAVVSLRNITRTKQQVRMNLCTPRLLSALRHLIISKYSSIQINSVAALVNLSLENGNKVKIVRSGIVPPLIHVLKGGFPEAQDHAAGALFSLALDDQNKTAIGVLGALPPLLHALRVGSERTRHDSGLALYHLSLVQSNRSKLVKLGSVQLFLSMVKTGGGRAMLLVLCNLAGSVEGRAAMLDGGAVECLLGLLSRGEFDSESTRECCLGALYGLSQGGLRFKGLAKEGGAEKLLMKELEETRSERCKEKANKILEVMRQKYEEEEEAVDWEALLNSDEVTPSRFELVYGKDDS